MLPSVVRAYVYERVPGVLIGLYLWLFSRGKDEHFRHAGHMRYIHTMFLAHIQLSQRIPEIMVKLLTSY